MSQLELPDDYDWIKVIESLSEIPTLLRKQVSMGANPARGAPSYESYTLDIPRNGGIFSVVGLDLSRVRLSLIANVDNVYFGKRANLSAGSGYPLPRANGFDITSTDEVFVAYLEADGAILDTYARVGVYLEKMSS